MALAHSTVEIEAMHSKADHSLPPISEALKFSYSKESKKEFDQAVARGKAAIDKAIEEKKEGKKKLRPSVWSQTSTRPSSTIALL
jgi:hypothetical protein